MADPFAGDLFGAGAGNSAAAAHRAFIETLPCLRCFVQFRINTCPSRAADAAIAGRGAPERDPAQWVIPLCARHAAAQPANPQAQALLWEKLGVDLTALCIALFADTGRRERARAAFIAQANRARCAPADRPFGLLDPASDEAKKIQAQFAKEEAIRV